MKILSKVLLLGSSFLILGVAFGNCARLDFTGTADSASKTGNNGEGYGGKPIIEEVINPSGTSSGDITIKGLNFGVANAAPLLWDDFEGGSDGTIIAAAPKIGSWKPSANALPTYTNITSHSGGLALQGNRSPAFPTSNFETPLPDSSDFYVSFWFNFNYAPSGTGNIDIFHLFNDPSNMSPEAYSFADIFGAGNDVWYSTIVLENTGRLAKIQYTTPVANTWHHFEAIARQSTVNTPDGIVSFFINGAKIYDQPAVATRERAFRWQWASFFTTMANFAGTTNSYIDDTFINNTWARVEIGDAPTYAACTRREIQVHSSWSDTQITLKNFNRGSFSPGQTVYVFVTNAGNVSSDGFAIQLP